MLTFGVKINKSKLVDKFALVEKQARFASILALTKTAQGVKDDLRAEMTAVFEAPTRFTLGSIYVTAATRGDPTAYIGIKGGAVAWMRPEIYGGARQAGLEKLLAPLGLPPPGLWAVPGVGAKLTKGKHVSLPWVRKVVDALRTAGPPNPSQKQKKRRKSDQFVVFTEKRGRAPAGIYKKDGMQIVPLIVFVRAPSYRAKFNFYRVAQESARRRFPQAWADAVAQTIRTAR